MTKFQTQIKRARNCSIPLVIARSADSFSTAQAVLQSFNGQAQSIPVFQWDVMRGLTSIPGNTPGAEVLAALLDGQNPAMVSARPSDALGLLATAPGDVIVLMHNLQLFWDDKPTLQGILNLRDRFKSIGSMLIGLALTGSALPAELTEHTLTLDDVLPTAQELETITREIFRSAELPEPSADTLRQTVDATQGLSEFAAEQSISLNLSKTGLDVRGTWQRKRQTIEADGLLKVYEGPESFQTIGGNEGFKTFNSRLFKGTEAPKAAILMDEIEKGLAQDSGNSTMTQLIGILLSWFQDRKIDGVLLNGVPGAGKTAGVKALGNEFGVPVVLFNASTMQNQFVGNSQKRLVTALDRIDAMCSGKPAVFATSNKLDSLSPELRSRFKLGTFFFDLPTAQERDAIWAIYTRVWEGLQGQEIPDSAGWTGREIEECCYKAYRFNIPLVESARYIIPVSRSSADSIKALRLQASGKFLSATESGIYRFEDSAAAPATGRKFRE